MKLNNFDRDDPPPRTHDSEWNRLTYRGFRRAGWSLLLLYLGGVNLWGGVWDEPFWIQLGWAVLMIWTLWPLLQAGEHAYYSLKELF